MATAIAVCGNMYYSNLDIQEVKRRIGCSEVIPVWWFASWGRRFSEDMLIPSLEHTDFLRTEQDD